MLFSKPVFYYSKCKGAEFFRPTFYLVPQLSSWWSTHIPEFRPSLSQISQAGLLSIIREPALFCLWSIMAMIHLLWQERAIWNVISSSLCSGGRPVLDETVWSRTASKFWVSWRIDVLTYHTNAWASQPLKVSFPLPFLIFYWFLSYRFKCKCHLITHPTERLIPGFTLIRLKRWQICEPCTSGDILV